MKVAVSGAMGRLGSAITHAILKADILNLHTLRDSVFYTKYT